MRFILLLLIFLSIHVGLEAETLRVGLVSPMSGDLSRAGSAVLKGMQLADKSIEGHKVKLIVEDNSTCGPKDAISGGRKLLSLDKVDVLVTVCTAAAQALLPLAKAQGIPLFQLTESGLDEENYMIKLMPDAAGMVSLLADIHSKHFSRIALLGSQMEVNSGTHGNLFRFKEEFESRGGKIVFEEEFPSDVKDFRSLITRVRASGADAVMPFIAPAAQMTVFLNQADQLHLWKDITLAGNFFFEFMQEELATTYSNWSKLDGLVSTNLRQTTKPNFLRAFEKEFKEKPYQFADYAYDAMTIIKRCGTKADCFREPFDGVSGSVTFDVSSGRRAGEFVARRLVKGVFRES